jgi:hypothetical protein
MKKIMTEVLNMKAIVEIQKVVRNLAKKESLMFKAAPNVNKVTLSKAADLKSQMDILEQKLKVLQEEYAPLREEILEDLPGEAKDKVEVLIDGVQLKKYPQVRGAGQLDQDKALKLVRTKKLLGALTKKVLVVDEDALTVAVSKGLISEKEYADCLTEGNVAVVLKVERKFSLSSETEDEQKAI